MANISQNGYRIDVLLSAIRIYLRRREIEKMCWCIEEIECYQKNKKNKRNLLIEHLQLFLETELSFIDIKTYNDVYEVLENARKDSAPNNARKDSAPNNARKDSAPPEIASRLCNARLSHVSKDLYEYSLRQKSPPPRPMITHPTPLTRSTTIPTPTPMTRSMTHPTPLTRSITVPIRIDKTKHLPSIASLFIQNAANPIIWKYFINNTKGILQTNMKYREKLYSKHKHPEILINAVLCMYYHEKVCKYITTTNPLPTTPLPRTTIPTTKLKLDEYVYDHSCLEGRKLHPTKTFTALISGFIQDEDKEFLDKDWRLYYLKQNKVSRPEKVIEETEPPSILLDLKHSIHKSRSRKVKRRKI